MNDNAKYPESFVQNSSFLLVQVLYEETPRQDETHKKFIRGNICERKWGRGQERLEGPSDSDAGLTRGRRQGRKAWVWVWVWVGVGGGVFGAVCVLGCSAVLGKV